ncbi:leucine-rich repeat flightless-interacting protein 2-like isoform X4 [Simochromis diagramma]|uniref:leucine-rich repeat flightless-interacting protein 2-like isoform X4 n=1 Tax=Simochromis diagramma TaxID=43689 RepID=UPI001A7EB626|nr:leucine-rich repeat flightless-interacting protein 2-like isoform X4 [Simochromis diagramma]
MGTQGPGRKRIPNREKLTGEDDALNQIAREAEARLAAKRAARAEAREIRMKELERQKELFHSHKKYYGVDNKWGHIEQWMEDSERYSRHSRRHASISDDEERMSVGSRGSLRPSDYSGFLGSGSRASSRASSARASPVVEDRTDREFPDKGSRTASTLSAATLASLGGASSRRGSCDTSFSVETEASIREMKDSLAETEEKYRKAMVSNAQLHNEKSTLMYQVETLREELNEMEELLWETRRRCDDAHKEWERERHAHSLLQFHFKDMKETLRQTEELLTKNGVTISPDITTNGDVELGGNEDDISAESASRLAQESPQGGRENMLGKTKEWETKEGNRPPENNKKNYLWKVLKRSKSLNDISTISKSKLIKQPIERQNTADKHLGGNEAARTKQPRPKRIKKIQSRQHGRLLHRKKGAKLRMNKERPGAACKIYEPKMATKPKNEFGLVSTAPANQDPTEETHSFSEQISKTQENSEKCPEVVSPVLKSKLFHHPTEHVIQDSKVVLLSVSSHNCDVSGSVEKVQVDKDTFHETAQSPEELKDQRIHEPARHSSSKCAERNIQTSTSFAPLDICAGLEKMTQNIHQGFAGNQVFVVEISQIFSEILGSLQKWTSDVENILKNKPSQHNKEQTGHMMDPTLNKHVEKCLTQPLGLLRDHSASRMLEVASTSKLYADNLDRPMNADQKAQRIMSKTHEMEVVELFGGNPADIDETTVTSCSEPFVFIDSYFTKPEEATAKVSGSNLGSSTSSKRFKSQSCHVVAAKNSKELVGDTDSCEEINEDGQQMEMEALAEVGSMKCCRRQRESCSDCRKNKKSECSIS